MVKIVAIDMELLEVERSGPAWRDLGTFGIWDPMFSMVVLPELI